MITREELEAREEQFLAPFAMRSRDSSGRVFEEEEHPYRTAYQRDRDRIIHTTAFRRLEYKTQVFVYSEGDHYRNRLTHSIEVAQIGRTLARTLGCNEDLIEAICLAHDLGHPPFGHVGENTLDDLMVDHDGFDHQKQTYRVITELSNRYPDHIGLNLTYEVREGVVKHDTDYDVVDARDYDPTTRGTLECQLSNLADEIAYNTSDLDDGLRSGILEPEIVAELGIAQRVFSDLGLAAGADLNDTMMRHRFIRRLVAIEVTDAIETTHANLAQHGVQTLQDVRNLPVNAADYSSELTELNAELKHYLFNEFYHHYRVVRMAAKARRVLQQLFGAYVEEPQQLPTSVQNKIRRATGEAETSFDMVLHRSVCNYLAGMTDRYAIQEHRRLYDPEERA